MLTLILRYLCALAIWIALLLAVKGTVTSPGSIIVFVLCMGAATISSFAGRSGKALTVGGAASYDPNKWSFDPETGEFHRVTFTSAEGRLIDPSTYHERSERRIKRLQEIRNIKRGTIATAIFSAICIALTVRSSSREPLGTLREGVLTFGFMSFVGCCAFVLSGLGWFFAVVAFRKAGRYELGPRPVAPQSPQDALDNDPNQARQPTPQEMAEAIRARGGGGREPSFPA